MNLKKKIIRIKLPLLFLVQDSWIDNNREIIAGKIETGKIKIGDKIKAYIEKVDKRSRKMSLVLTQKEKPVTYR